MQPATTSTVSSATPGTIRGATTPSTTRPGRRTCLRSGSAKAAASRWSSSSAQVGYLTKLVQLLGYSIFFIQCILSLLGLKLHSYASIFFFAESLEKSEVLYLHEGPDQGGTIDGKIEKSGNQTWDLLICSPMSYHLSYHHSQGYFLMNKKQSHFMT